MSLLTALIAIGAIFVSSADSRALHSRDTTTLSNADTSLTLLYQNNLNASDDKNHVGALLLDPATPSGAAAACGALNEKLLPQSTLTNYKADFIPALTYLSYAKYLSGPASFYIENGIVSVNSTLQITSDASSEAKLPVLCTQSANNGQFDAPPMSGSQVTVSSGSNTFTGYRQQKSFRFLGIPYADKPQRWKYSSLYSKTGQTIDATKYGSPCAQSTFGSEDCLFLNIQTPYIPKAAGSQDPKPKNLRPVLFWIHGGGFTGGSGGDPVSDGGNLASREDLVVVAMNYRLSTLGFLAVPGTDIKGNYGIGDQIVALDWVLANIASFGGDPEQITIMGGSAGAGSVRTLLGSHKAIGKFQAAVAVSNLGGGKTLGLDSDYGTTYSSYYTIEESYAVAGPQIFGAAGCNSSSVLATQISCLTQVPASTLVGLSTVARYVVQDGTIVNTPELVLTAPNNNTASVPVIFGVTRNDGASFSTYPTTPISSHAEGLQTALGINSTWADRIIASDLFPLTDTGNLTLDSFNVSQRIATDKTFRCVDQATVYAGTSAAIFPAAWFYQFERTESGYDPNNLGGPRDNNPNNPYFRLHGSEVAFIFGVQTELRDAEDLWMQQLVAGYFSSFVRSRQPNPDAGYLSARGYDRVAEGVKESGEWEAVKIGATEQVKMLDWPSKDSGFVDVEQCEWLGYGLDYYLKGGT